MKKGQYVRSSELQTDQLRCHGGEGGGDIRRSGLKDQSDLRGVRAGKQVDSSRRPILFETMKKTEKKKTRWFHQKKWSCHRNQRAQREGSPNWENA